MAAVITRRERLRRGPYAALLIALFAGIGIAYVDSRPGWDATGITAVFVLAVSGVRAFWRPRYAWCFALLVGGFIPLIEGLGDGNSGALLALVVTATGSGFGWLVRRADTPPP